MTKSVSIIDSIRILFPRYRTTICKLKLIIATPILWIIILLYTDKNAKSYSVYSELEGSDDQIPLRNIDGPGEMGKSVEIYDPGKDTNDMIDKGWVDNGFNQYVSEKISIHRSPNVTKRVFEYFFLI